MKRLPKIINQEEFEKVLKAEDNKSIKLAMLLGFEAGMRISEIVGLKNKDGTVKIPALTSEMVGSAQIKIISGKGNKDRIVPRPKRMNETALKLLPIKENRRTLQRHFKQLTKKVLNKDLNFHVLRHGFGSHLASKNRPLHEIQMLMGHSRLDTTGIYLHANPQQAIDGAREIF